MPDQALVPVFRTWWGPAIEAWSRFMYPPGRSWFIFGGCLLIWLSLIVIGVKAIIYWSVVAAIVALALITAMWDLCTYRRRCKRAILEEEIAE